MRTFAYIQTTSDKPDEMEAAVPEHTSYWINLELPGYMGGPFADRSGGLIIFDAESLEEAETLVSGDPFVKRNLIESMLLKEWNIEYNMR